MERHRTANKRWKSGKIIFILSRNWHYSDTFLIVSRWGFTLNLGLTSHRMIFSASIPTSRLFLGVPIFILWLEKFLVASCLCVMLIRKDLGQPCTCRTQESNFHLSTLRQAIAGHIPAARCTGFCSSPCLIFGSWDINLQKNSKDFLKTSMLFNTGVFTF